MADTYNVFISWSGDRSKGVAAALREWLPMVVQTAEPWMSEEDIEKGSRGLDDIGKALAAMGVGIICLTPENLERPWILFEAGALSKALGDKTRVCPYLFGDLRPENVKPPLGMFQATKAVKDDTRKLVATVNRVLGGPLGEEKLGTVFDRMWPELEKRLEAVPKVPAAAAPQRSEREMLAEMLELARAGAGHDEVVEGLLAKLHGRVALILEEVRPSVPLSALADLTRGWREADARAMGRVGYRGLLSDLAGLVSKTGSEAEGKDVKQKQEQHRMHAPGRRGGVESKTGDKEK